MLTSTYTGLTFLKSYPKDSWGNVLIVRQLQDFCAGFFQYSLQVRCVLKVRNVSLSWDVSVLTDRTKVRSMFYLNVFHELCKIISLQHTSCWRGPSKWLYPITNEIFITVWVGKKNPTILSICVTEIMSQIVWQDISVTDIFTHARLTWKGTGVKSSIILAL